MYLTTVRKDCLIGRCKMNYLCKNMSITIYEMEAMLTEQALSPLPQIQESMTALSLLYQ